MDIRFLGFGVCPFVGRPREVRMVELASFRDARIWVLTPEETLWNCERVD